MRHANNPRDGRNRELSYPSLVLDPTGDLPVAFTHHRQATTYLRLPASRIADALGG